MLPTESHSEHLKIQSWGTFDVDNYGDLLFPILLEAELKKRLPEVKFDLYSPKGGWFAPQPTKWVERIPRIEEKKFFSKFTNCQGIIVGGGDLIRFDDRAMTHVYGISEEQAEQERSYRVFIKDLEYVAPLIPVLWNAVGIPFEFDEQQALEVRKSLQNVAYISVRDSFSREKLLNAGVEQELYIVPDTAFLVERYYPRATLADIKNILIQTEQFPAGGKVICFQIAPAATPHVQELANTLNKLLEVNTELEVVFLPIGVCHSDASILRSIQERIDKKTYLVQETTDLRIVTSVIAHSDYFAGSSLHGNIVSYTYGVPHLFLDFFNLAKIRGVAAVMGSEQQIVTQVGRLTFSLLHLIQQPKDWVRKLPYLIQEIDSHFDRCAEILQKQSKQTLSQGKVLKSAARVNEALYCFLKKVETNGKQTKVELERSQFYLQEALQNSQSEREQFQAQLQQTQTELERSQFYLQEALQNSQAEREQFQLQLQQTQVELERSQFYLQEAFQNSQAERERFQLQCIQNNADLVKIQSELSQTHLALQQAMELTAAMQSSKFWKLRTKWLKIKTIFRLSRVKTWLKKLKNKPQTQGRQSSAPEADLLAIPNISYENFWNILNPTLQEQLVSLEGNIPIISILTPTFNSSLDWFIETVLSVFNQSTSAWEWCLVDDGSTTDEIRTVLTELADKHPRIKVVLQESGGISSATNKALEMASGDYICFLDHDDTLAPTALQDSLDKLSEGFDIIYSDEDKIDFSGLSYVEPFFKPNWSPEYFRGVMYVGHLLCVRRELALKVGGLRSEYDGVQDYEFMLRLSECTQNIGHIPKILYHWRKIEGSVAGDINAKPAVEKLQQAAVNEHLLRLGLPATAKGLGNHRIEIIPSTKTQYPLVSIIIPTKDAPEHLERCLKSIFSVSTYPNFEVLLVDNETTDPNALQLMKQFSVERLCFPNPFNYSRANNLGAKYAQGEYLVFLNNDTEILTKDWLQHLLYYAEQPDVGAAGALLLFPDKTVQHAGVVLGIRGTADHLMRGFSSNVDGYGGSLVCAREVSAVTAACMMVNRNEFYKVGAFNEHFFTHYQDVDLCMRFLDSGQRIIFTPRAVLTHYESATRKEYYDFVDCHLLLDQWQQYINNGDSFYNSNFDIRHYDYTVKAQ